MPSFEFDPATMQNVPRGTSFEYDPASQRDAMPGDALPGKARFGLGILEGIGNVATSGIGAVAGGLVGGSHALMYGPDRGADVTRQVQEGLTYQPRTRAGQTTQGVISAIPQAYSEHVSQPVADWSEERMGPAVGAMTKAGMEALPSLIAKGAQGPARAALKAEKANQASAAARNALRDQTIKDAQDLGLVMPSPTTTGRALSSIGGKAQLRQDMAVHNQEVYNRVARKEAGLAPDQPITEQALESARTIMAGPYREVAKVSPKAKKAFDDMQQARADAKAQWRFYNTFPDPKVMKRAQAADAKASMLEGVIDAEAVRVSQGAPTGLAKTLVKDIRAARVAMAKNYDVERAVNIGTGDVDARQLGRMMDKGSPFTGDLAKIARFAEGPGWEVSRETARVGIPGGQHGTALEVGAGAILGGMSGGPQGAIAGAGLPLIRGPARSLALSKIMQPRPSYKQSLGFNLGEIATQAPEAYMLAPPLADKPQPNPWDRYSR